ncbi:Arginyl-tRNA synthetase [Linnemannia gamsii]|uniref:arginine--tRNA ligase n=1 Tax=Linnemannia gamsii TaxID=64522 RepID=A0ABQ7JM55_9FUNG|nr:Arginyl-tRNA synthetase [Linnemannia gamsii]
MTELTLVSFRRAIATHLSGIVGQSAESLMPLVQQNTTHRKASHSVFSVVIKRLHHLHNSKNSSGGDGEKGVTVTVLDEQVLERCCSELSVETREWIVAARKTRDMLLFDPQPLQLIQKAVGAIVERSLGEGRRSGGGGRENVEEVLLGKRVREELGSVEQESRAVVMLVVDGVKTLQDENAFCSLRRTVLAGFVARVLSSTSGLGGVGDVKVIANPGSDEFLQGLDVESPTLSDSIGDDDSNYLMIVKRAFQTESEIKAQQINSSSTEDGGAWVVDLSAQKLGHVKVFSSSKTGGSTADGGTVEMGDPTAVVETMVQMARRFAQYGGNVNGDGAGEVRYIWVVPDGRRLFVEQVLFLARVIFPRKGELRLQSGADEATLTGTGTGEGQEPDRKKRAGATGPDVATDSGSLLTTKSWADLVDVVYYGPAAGVDLPKDPSSSSLFAAIGSEMGGIVEYTNVKMQEVVEQNRGGGGVGGYSGAYGNDEYDDDDDGDDGDKGLNEAELARMSKVLSRSALVVACCGGKRVRKLNVSLSRILDGKGNSGVFLQYVLSRLYGIERKSKTRFNASADLSHLASYTESLDLALLLAEYPETLSELQKSLDPSVLVTYLFDLAAMAGQANRVLRVKGMEVEVAEARWLLFWAAKRVFEEGLQLLGLEFLERM